MPLPKNELFPGLYFCVSPTPRCYSDSQLSSADYRRVDVDKKLADVAANVTITTGSYVADMKRGEHRRSFCKLVASTGKDDDQALVKLEARCATPGNRSFYDPPLYTFTLVNGW